MCLAHQRGDTSEAGCGTDSSRTDCDAAIHCDGATSDRAASSNINGDALTSEHRFIDGTCTRQHNAIDGDDVTRIHQQGIPDHDEFSGDGFV